ncbi:cell division protein MraZ [Streptococcus mitis]|jgi:hypothetical protein|uniref:cell division protein MraZ n=1 Tax=Streptococcus mitis TaxID=28037 RepID=UPI0021B80BE8|nr:cell division protein MraZ [Streptococcus mitis]
MVGFWKGMRERIIADQQAKLDDVAYSERLNNIGKAATALLEAGIDKERTKTLLQKHWDLRPSEAQDFIDFVYRYNLKRNN